MNTQKHILYVLAALLGSSAVAGLAGAEGYYAQNGAYRDGTGYTQKLAGPRGSVPANVPQIQSLPAGVVAYETVPYQPQYGMAPNKAYSVQR